MKQLGIRVCTIIMFLAVTQIQAQDQSAAPTSIAQISAREEFRWGVKAYHNGYYNESIISFEKALSFQPESSQIREWLGLAYYRSGFEETALDLWRGLADSGDATAYLRSVIETVNVRRGLARDFASEIRYLTAHTVYGTLPEYRLFFRPTGLTASKNGGYYLASFATGEVIKFTTNGTIQSRNKGALEGFDHPFDVAEDGLGRVFVSEFEGNRIAVIDPKTGRITRFGRTGTGDGAFVGPQYMSIDGGYVYISDFGNRRISKFDTEGNYIFSFGRPTVSFSGLKRPSGVAVLNDRVFVADSGTNTIHVFDEYGNFVETLASFGLHGPEGMTVFKDGKLLVADSDRLVVLDPYMETLSVVTDLEGSARRITGAAWDANGDIVVADFDANTVTHLTDVEGLYSGFYIRIDRVDATAFPEIYVDLNVQTRLGDQITGLDNRNFIVTENRYGVINQEIVLSDKADDLEIAVLVERSIEMAERKPEIRTAMETMTGAIRGSTAGGDLRVITAGSVAVLETTAETTDLATIEAAVESGDYSSNWRFDLGLRLAASSLIPGRSKRAVVFLGTGELLPSAFDQYGLIDLARYLANNGIRFYAVSVDPGATFSAEIDYLCRETGGERFSFYEPRGTRAVVDSLSSEVNGNYTLRYTSNSNADFGNAFIPIEVESLLFNRSGRAETGYFSPFEF